MHIRESQHCKFRGTPSHLAQALCFTDEGLEAQEGKVVCPYRFFGGRTRARTQGS